MHEHHHGHHGHKHKKAIVSGGHGGEGSEHPHHHRHKHFYRHLCWHPHYHAAASAAAKRVAAGDSATKAALAELVQKGKAGDRSAANAAMAIAVCCKFECGTEHHGDVVSGAVPMAAHAAGKLVRLILAPAAWTAGLLGRFASFTGRSLHNLSATL